MTSVSRSNEVTVVGCEDAFWQLSDLPVRPTVSPRGRQIILNEPLAETLNVQRGDRVVLRLGKVGGVAPDSTLARKSDLTQNLAGLEVIDIIPAEGLGRFSLAQISRSLEMPTCPWRRCSRPWRSPTASTRSCSPVATERNRSRTKPFENCSGKSGQPSRMRDFAWIVSQLPTTARTEHRLRSRLSISI